MMTRYEEYLERKSKEESYKGITIPSRKALNPNKRTEELITRYNNNEATDEELESHFNKFYMLEE